MESGTSGGKNKEFVDGLFSKEQKFKGPPKQDRDDKPRMSLEFEAKKFIGKTRTESAVTTTSDGGLSFSDERGEGAGSNRADSAGTQQTNGLNARKQKKFISPLTHLYSRCLVDHRSLSLRLCHSGRLCLARSVSLFTAP